MKVVLNSFPLTGDKPSEQTKDGMTINGSQVLDLPDLVRAVEGGLFQRGNVRNVLAFEIAREHESAGHAEFFCLQHILAICALSGRLDLTIINPDNNVTIGTCFFTNAAVQTWNLKAMGASTDISYSVTCGIPQFQS